MLTDLHIHLLWQVGSMHALLYREVLSTALHRSTALHTVMSPCSGPVLKSATATALSANNFTFPLSLPRACSLFCFFQGWKTGKCVEATGVSKVCEGCGEAMVSSTEELLKKVFQAHYHLMPACNPLRGKIEYVRLLVAVVVDGVVDGVVDPCL